MSWMATLHAIAIAPITLHPRQWLPKIWGSDQMMPSGEFARQDQSHPRPGIPALQQHHCQPGKQPAGTLYDVGNNPVSRKGVMTTLKGWAYGFIEGMRLCWHDWQPLLSTKEGQAWFRPIGLLAEHDFSPDQDELTKTPARRAKLALQIPDAIVAMHAFWIPQRLAAAQEIIAKASAPKVGRNDPCPCGSGQKFKKCCGRGPSLH
jgi:uncharacterized protein